MNVLLQKSVDYDDGQFDIVAFNYELQTRRQLNLIGEGHGEKYSFFYTCLTKYCQIKLRL